MTGVLALVVEGWAAIPAEALAVVPAPRSGGADLKVTAQVHEEPGAVAS
jgi:hypothetical protein